MLFVSDNQVLYARDRLKSYHSVSPIRMNTRGNELTSADRLPGSQRPSPFPECKVVNLRDL
jgi:hypothetical protein